ncbi:hypothetical protein C4D60_Mb02t00450 [Musa balbisiana]|uniref:Uncharacterized protein n=1 Tax=Musa balbisiana TaxID=52838 RepID=A0A4S8I777_MUSBA|nr:hypothetical protein C4D60_Mb02t00450 [Musa balbisiana]
MARMGGARRDVDGARRQTGWLVEGKVVVMALEGGGESQRVKGVVNAKGVGPLAMGAYDGDELNTTITDLGRYIRFFYAKSLERICFLRQQTLGTDLFSRWSEGGNGRQVGYPCTTITPSSKPPVASSPSGLLPTSKLSNT